MKRASMGGKHARRSTVSRSRTIAAPKSRDLRTRARPLLAVALLALLLTGCIRPQVVKHPGAPMLITGAKRGYLRVSVYDRSGNRLLDAGWVRGSDVKGWTLHKYDWEEYVNGR